MKLNGTWLAIVGTLLLLAFAITYPAWAPRCALGEPCLEVNEYGDWIAGVVQPLALAWLIAGFWLQRKELALQRQELEETRAELKRQADAASSTDLTARRNLFVTASPLIISLLDQHIGEIGSWFSLSDRDKAENVGLYLASNLMDDAPPERSGKVHDYVESEHFARTRTAYMQIFNRLLALAEDADAGGYPTFALTARSTARFGFYKMLQDIPPKEAGHPSIAVALEGDYSNENWYY